MHQDISVDDATSAYVSALKICSLFANMPASELELIARDCRFEECNPSAVVFRQGDEAHALFILLEGHLTVSISDTDGTEVLLRTITEVGDFSGEQAFLTQQTGRRSATLRASTYARLLLVPGNDFKAKLRDTPELRSALEKAAIERVRQNVTHFNPMLRALAAESSALAGLPTRRYRPGEIVCRQGEYGKEMYVVLSGTACVFETRADGTVVERARIASGRSFGELSLIEKSPRVASVRAEEDLVVLVIDADIVLGYLDKNRAASGYFEELKRSYVVFDDGLALQFSSDLHGMPAVATLIRRTGHAPVVAQKVVGRDIWSIRVEAPLNKAGRTVTFRDPDLGIERQLVLDGPRVHTANIRGAWSQIAFLHDRVFRGQSLTDEEVARFEQTGALPEPVLLDATLAGAVVCHCMGVTRGTLMAAIAEGCGTVEALSLRTGAGTVCGGCRPAIADLTAETIWQPAEVADVIERTPSVRSVRFKVPPAFADRPIRAGQHITVRVDIADVPVQRTYTLTSTPADAEFYEITVKREPTGTMSRWLHDVAAPGTRVELLPPAGSSRFDLSEARPLVCVVGGIGVTPALAIARATAGADGSRPMHVEYCVPDAAQAVCLDEWRTLAADERRTLTFHLHETATRGRIRADDIGQLHRTYDDADWLICGSKSFQDHVAGALAAEGTQPARVHIESFDPQGQATPAPSERPATDRRRSLVALVMLACLLLVVAQALYLPRDATLLPKQGTLWSIATGLVLVALYVAQWRLPYLRAAERFAGIPGTYAAHIWIGPAIVLALLLHASRLGHNATLALSLCFCASLASGAFVVFARQDGPQARLRDWLVGAHVLLSVGALGLIATHGAMAVWYLT